MSLPTTINPTGLKAQDSELEAKLWAAGAQSHEQTEDIFTPMEGGGDALIEVETSLAAGKGHEITFRSESGFYGEGKMDEEDYQNEDDYEELLMASDKLRVGLIRNGTRFWFLTEEELGMRNEIHSGLNEKLGDWLGREKTFQMCQSLIHQVSLENHIVGELTFKEILEAGSMIRPMGGAPAYMHKDSQGNKIFGACFVTPTEGLAVLEDDPDYLDILKMSEVRGRGNPLFTGDTVMVKGNIIKHWDVKDHDGEGAIGSPLNPKAYLGVAVAPATTTFMMRGGSNGTAALKTKHKFFKFFPRYNFRFCGGSSVAVEAPTHLLNGTPGSKKFYVTIVNPKTAPTDPGKWCIYEVSANDGHQLTVSARLGPTDSGIQVDELGAVTWDAAKHTQTHPVGSLVYWSDNNGVPLGRTVGLWKKAARRGYGQFRARRFTDSQEGGAKKELYIGSIFGQRPRVDRLKRNPGVLVINHPLKYAGWNHPTPA